MRAGFPRRQWLAMRTGELDGADQHGFRNDFDNSQVELIHRRNHRNVSTVASAPSRALPSSSASAALQSLFSHCAASLRPARRGATAITRSNFEVPRAWVSE